MNYDKKRKRQNGRQGIGTLSERERIYRQGHFDGASELIQRLKEAGILPEIKYDLKSVTQDEFKKSYPPENKE